MADDNPIPMWQKMISACSGSLVTSVVVTPFDVIRVRIQQQELLGPGPALVCKEPQGRPQPSAPFWTTSNYCHACDCQRITSTWQGMKSIAQREGLPTLWRGLSLTLFMSIPSNIIYFTGYEFIRDHSPIYHHSLNPLVCGMLARTISATSVAPFELIKTRLQSVPSTGTSGGMLRKLWRQTQADVQTNGWRTLFTGLTITLWRDVPFSGIYWLGYERIKAYIRRHTDPSKNSHVFMNSFISGSLSGSVAAIMTHPFDVGKTRLQIEATHSGSAMFKFLWQIGRDEGIGALYAGLTPRVMKIAPACAIMISSYEIGKKFFMTH